MEGQPLGRRVAGMVEYKLLGSTPPAFSGRTGLLPPPGKRHAGLKQGGLAEAANDCSHAG